MIIVVPFFHRPVYSIQHASPTITLSSTPVYSIQHGHRRLFCPFLPQTSIFHTTCCHRRLLLSLSSTDQYIPYNMLSPTIIVVPFFHSIFHTTCSPTINRPVYSIQHAVTDDYVVPFFHRPVYSIQHATDDYCCPFLPQTSIFHTTCCHRRLELSLSSTNQYIPYNMLSPTIRVVPFFHKPLYSIQHDRRLELSLSSTNSIFHTTCCHQRLLYIFHTT